MSTVNEINEAIEVLERAKASVSDPRHRFNYSDWRHCACGHVYRAVHGRYASENGSVASPLSSSAYGKVMRTIGAAMPSLPGLTNHPDRPDLDGPSKLSLLTASGLDGKAKGNVTKQDAIRAYDRVLEGLHKNLPTGMDIGKEIRTIQVEPAKTTIPHEEPVRRSIPTHEPVEAPERDPERVGAE